MTARQTRGLVDGLVAAVEDLGARVRSSETVASERGARVAAALDRLAMRRHQLPAPREPRDDGPVLRRVERAEAAVIEAVERLRAEAARPAPAPAPAFASSAVLLLGGGDDDSSDDDDVVAVRRPQAPPLPRVSIHVDLGAIDDTADEPSSAVAPAAPAPAASKPAPLPLQSVGGDSFLEAARAAAELAAAFAADAERHAPGPSIAAELEKAGRDDGAVSASEAGASFDTASSWTLPSLAPSSGLFAPLSGDGDDAAAGLDDVAKSLERRAAELRAAKPAREASWSTSLSSLGGSATSAYDEDEYNGGESSAAPEPRRRPPAEPRRRRWPSFTAAAQSGAKPAPDVPLPRSSALLLSLDGDEAVRRTLEGDAGGASFLRAMREADEALADVSSGSSGAGADE